MMNENKISYDELVGLLKASQQQVASQNDMLATLHHVIQDLRQQLAKFQAMLFGASSERKSHFSKKPKKEESEVRKQKPSDIKTKPKGRKDLPAEFPRETKEYDLRSHEKNCVTCHSPLRSMGFDTSEQLEYIPAQFLVIVHKRHKYSCRSCQTVVTAKMPTQPIDKGLPGPGLLAETVVAKYQDHLPLHRQEMRYERSGFKIARSTLCDWVAECAVLLKPIVQFMQNELLHSSPKIHSDDTTIPILQKGKTHQGRLWVYVGGGGRASPCVIYRYTRTRSGQEPLKFLAEYQGYLQADAYNGYDRCYQSKKIIEVACHAHARRKFTDAVKCVENDSIAKQAIDYYAELYHIESKTKNMDDFARYYYRRKYSKPILRAFYRWLKKQKRLMPPKSPLGVGIDYCLKHWVALTNYLRDGVLSIDNNIAERMMRSVAVGRKNYLFAGSDLGAEHAAIIYSIIETCKLLKINTTDYLRDVLQRLPNTLNSELHTLVPHYWKNSSIQNGNMD